MSRDAFAALYGISHATLKRYEYGEVAPKVTFLERVATGERVSLNWLRFGTGEMREPENELKQTKIDVSESPVPEPDLVMIPMVEAKLSAGCGSFETSGDSERTYAFRHDFLARKGSVKDMVLMRVSGDSMTPTIKDGDTVLIDQSQNQPLPGRMYAVGVEDMVYLKHVDARPGKLTLYSDNKAYEPLEIITGDQCENMVRIIGRAIWVGREL